MQKKEKSKVTTILIWIFQIMLVIALAAGVAYGCCSSIVMQEGSMEPTISAGEKLLINKVIYKISDPKRGDMIAFRKNAKKESSLYIKRIVGLPGETIQIKDGMILINDETYMEKNNFPVITNPGMADEKITLGINEYFVLGDNRNSSEDSRFGDVGNVIKNNIVGKLWCVIAPFDKIGLLKS